MPEDPRYDVFVSYAHADNDVPRGSSTDVGWVTALVDNLNIGPNVRKKRLFIDHQLKPGDAFSTDLLAKVERSAVLLLLLSQNYVKSDWCGMEVEHFIRSHAADPDQPTGIYVVELWPYEKLPEPPAAIQLLRKRLIATKFWYQPVDAPSPSLAGYPTPRDGRAEGNQLYWRVLNDLQVAIDSRLAEVAAGQARSAEAAAATATAPAAAGGGLGSLGTVLLADTTEDLEAQRNKLKARLEPEGIRVLPERGDYVGLDPQEFEAAVAGDLASAGLFVQLLSPTAGRRGKLELPLPQLQYQRALAAGKPILQWASRQPEPDDLSDPGHARLFETATLRITHLAEFANVVIATLRAEKEREERAAAERQRLAAQPPEDAGPGERRPARRHIFIDDVASERALTDRVRHIVKEQNFAWRSGQPPNVDIQEWLRPCVAGLTIYSDPSKRDIAQSRLIHFLNQVADGKVDLQNWGVFLTRGTVASEFGFEADGLVDVTEQGLADFLRGIAR